MDDFFDVCLPTRAFDTAFHDCFRCFSHSIRKKIPPFMDKRSVVGNNDLNDSVFKRHDRKLAVKLPLHVMQHLKYCCMSILDSSSDVLYDSSNDKNSVKTVDFEICTDFMAEKYSLIV